MIFYYFLSKSVNIKNSKSFLSPWRKFLIFQTLTISSLLVLFYYLKKILPTKESRIFFSYTEIPNFLKHYLLVPGSCKYSRSGSSNYENLKKHFLKGEKKLIFRSRSRVIYRLIEGNWSPPPSTRNSKFSRTFLTWPRICKSSRN